MRYENIINGILVNSHSLKETERVRKRLTARDIPTGRRDAILSSLQRAKGKVEIVYLSDSETLVFAQRLGKIIREAGWETTEQGAMGFGAIIGLRIEIHDEKTSPVYTSILKQALELAFENVAIRTTPSTPEGGLRLIVGSKPAD